MKYRKKAVVIEAFKWTGGPDQTDDPVWAVEAIKKGNMWFEHNPFCMKIKTLEGIMTGSIGDFIIQGVKGEIYACNPDIFSMTYEPAEDLLESKPEPKNCGNCAYVNALNRNACNGCVVKEYSNWQPKSAEPQEWEQRLCAKCNNGCPGNDRCLYLITIRAEIERVRLEEQNKHREGEK